MAAVWDATWSPDWTLSNGNKTISLSSSGRHNAALNLAVLQKNLLGTKHYIEINIDAYTPVNIGELKVGAYSDSNSPDDSIVNPSQAGQFSAVADLNVATQEILFRGPFTSVLNDCDCGSASYEGTVGSWLPTAGDRIGLLYEFGTPTHPFHLGFRFYVNGVCQASSFQPYPGDGAWSTRTTRPCMVVDWSGAGTVTATIIDQGSWSFEPDVVPNVQEWSNTIVAPTLVDNGYCRIDPMRGWGQQPIGINVGATPLSNKDLTITAYRSQTAAKVINYMCIGTKPRHKGKYYFEVTVDDLQPASPMTTGHGNILGICSGWSPTPSAGGGSDQRFTAYESASNSGGASGDDWGVIGGTGTTPGSPVFGGDLPQRRSVNGDVYMVAVDMADDTNNTGNETKVWIGVNGTFDGDPVAGTGFASGPTQGYAQGLAWYPLIELRMTQVTAKTREINTANFGGSTFAYTPPTGFVAWDSTAVPS